MKKVVALRSLSKFFTAQGVLKGAVILSSVALAIYVVRRWGSGLDLSRQDDLEMVPSKGMPLQSKSPMRVGIPAVGVAVIGKKGVSVLKRRRDYLQQTMPVKTFLAELKEKWDCAFAPSDIASVYFLLVTSPGPINSVPEDLEEVPKDTAPQILAEVLKTHFSSGDVPMYGRIARVKAAEVANDMDQRVRTYLANNKEMQQRAGLLRDFLAGLGVVGGTVDVNHSQVNGCFVFSLALTVQNMLDCTSFALLGDGSQERHYLNDLSVEKVSISIGKFTDIYVSTIASGAPLQKRVWVKQIVEQSSEFKEAVDQRRQGIAASLGKVWPEGGTFPAWQALESTDQWSRASDFKLSFVSDDVIALNCGRFIASDLKTCLREYLISCGLTLKEGLEVIVIRGGKMEAAPTEAVRQGFLDSLNTRSEEEMRRRLTGCLPVGWLDPRIGVEGGRRYAFRLNWAEVKNGQSINCFDIWPVLQAMFNAAGLAFSATSGRFEFYCAPDQLIEKVCLGDVLTEVKLHSFENLQDILQSALARFPGITYSIIGSRERSVVFSLKVTLPESSKVDTEDGKSIMVQRSDLREVLGVFFRRLQEKKCLTVEFKKGALIIISDFKPEGLEAEVPVTMREMDEREILARQISKFDDEKRRMRTIWERRACIYEAAVISQKTVRKKSKNREIEDREKVIIDRHLTVISERGGLDVESKEYKSEMNCFSAELSTLYPEDALKREKCEMEIPRGIYKNLYIYLEKSTSFVFDRVAYLYLIRFFEAMSQVSRYIDNPDIIIARNLLVHGEYHFYRDGDLKLVGERLWLALADKANLLAYATKPPSEADLKIAPRFLGGKDRFGTPFCAEPRRQATIEDSYSQSLKTLKERWRHRDYTDEERLMYIIALVENINALPQDGKWGLRRTFAALVDIRNHAVYEPRTSLEYFSSRKADAESCIHQAIVLRDF
jgi:hypothetical protein